MIKENEILKLYKQAKKEKKERLQKNIKNLRIDIRYKKKDNEYVIYIYYYTNKKYIKIDKAKIEIINNNYKIANLKEILQKIKELELKNIKNTEKNNNANELKFFVNDFFKYIENMNLSKQKKRQKKKYIENNLKTYLNNKNIETEEDIIDYLNFCIKNSKRLGVSKNFNSNNCYLLKNNITVLKDFARFLFTNKKINKDMYNLIINFNFNTYFANCKNIKNNNYKTFSKLEELKDFYNILIYTRLFLIKKIQEKNNYIEFKKHFKFYKDAEILYELGEPYVFYKNYNKTNYLKLIGITIFLEILVITGMRKSDLFKIFNNEYIYDKKNMQITFLISKNKDNYVLYLTEYLKTLFDFMFYLIKKYNINFTEVTIKNFLYNLIEKEYIRKLHIHGLRHSFKSFGLEFLNTDNAIIEIQMGHKLAGVQEHYRVTNLKNKRLKLLQDWEFLIKNKEIEDSNFVWTIRNKALEEIFEFLKKMKKEYLLNKNDIIKILKDL